MKLDNIDRNRQKQNDVTITDVPKSGINLTYMSHNTHILGRLLPTAYHHCLPADKISGSTESEITFEPVSTPVMGSMQMAHHNFLITLRSLNTEWKAFQTPTKLNGMSASMTAPNFNIYTDIYLPVISFLENIVSINTNNGFRVAINNNKAVWTAAIPASWKNHYIDDVLEDLYRQLMSDVSGSGLLTTATPTLDITTNNTAFLAFRNFFIDAISFFAGKRSLLDSLGYQIFGSDLLVDSFDNLINLYKSTQNNDFYDVFNDADDRLSSYVGTLWYLKANGLYKPMNEYALRAYYAVWFEYYRNYDLEPRSANLSEYHSWGSTSIIAGGTSIEKLHFCVLRPRAWSPDAFNQAGIDDISRHIFAPILNNTSAYPITTDVKTDGMPSANIGNRTTIQQLSWINPNTGLSSSVSVPVPERLVSAITTSTAANTFGLELFSLKKASMLENYLKRIFYGGDEYRDRMLSLYGAKIEDYRINRPMWLSSAYQDVSPTQQVANSGAIPGSQNGGVIQGQRVATAGVSSSAQDGYTEFVPEHAIVLCLTSIMPRAQYDVLCPQNLQLKTTDYPIPQFANSMEDMINNCEISRSSFSFTPFGYAPYGHAYRYRVDEVHGDYLDTKFDYTFSRYFRGLTLEQTPKLNYQFIHCRPELPMFVDSILLDGQAYGKCKNNFLVERVLPTPVEVI